MYNIVQPSAEFQELNGPNQLQHLEDLPVRTAGPLQISY